MTDQESTTKPQLTILVTEDWFFYGHWQALFAYVRERGFDVHVICRTRDCRESIEKAGFSVTHIEIERSSLNVWNDFKLLWQLRRELLSQKTDILLNIAMKPILYGSLAAWMSRLPATINLFAGLGYLFSSQDVKAKIVKPVALSGLRLACKLSKAFVVTPNTDDLAILQKAGIVPTSRSQVIPGNGIDVSRFQISDKDKDQDSSVTFAIAARMIADKGLVQLVDAFRLLRDRIDPDAATPKLILAGEPDSGNPTSIPRETLEMWDKEEGITWIGYCDDIRSLWAQADVAILPSRREGLPVSLMEAAACGLPMIATDVTGCRDVVRDGKTGLLVPLDNVIELSDAMERLLRDPAERLAMGQAARTDMETNFALNVIGDQLTDLCHQLIDQA